MMQNYHDLYELFENDQRAKQYYDNLPDTIRNQLTRAGGVNSFKSLRDYAENLLRSLD